MTRWLLIAGLLAAGCHKDDDEGPPCAAVVDHMLDIMKSTNGGHGGMNLGSRQSMIDTCEARHMPKLTRACLVNSKDITGLANCSRMTAPPSAPSTKPALPAPPAPSAPPPAPATGSGTPAT